jgi:alanine racemase
MDRRISLHAYRRSVLRSNGFAVCEVDQAIALRDRAQAAGRDTPVLLLEGWFCPRDLEECVRAGVVPVIHDEVQIGMHTLVLERVDADA